MLKQDTAGGSAPKHLSGQQYQEEVDSFHVDVIGEWSGREGRRGGEGRGGEHTHTHTQ